MTIATSDNGGRNDESRLADRVNDYGVSLDQLVGTKEDRKHKVVIEMKGRQIDVDFVFKEIVNAGGNGKTAQK